MVKDGEGWVECEERGMDGCMSDEFMVSWFHEYEMSLEFRFGSLVGWMHGSLDWLHMSICVWKEGVIF